MFVGASQDYLRSVGYNPEWRFDYAMKGEHFKYFDETTSQPGDGMHIYLVSSGICGLELASFLYLGNSLGGVHTRGLQRKACFTSFQRVTFTAHLRICEGGAGRRAAEPLSAHTLDGRAHACFYALEFGCAPATRRFWSIARPTANGRSHWLTSAKGPKEAKAH